jgi:hypothetical protein
MDFSQGITPHTLVHMHTPAAVHGLQYKFSIKLYYIYVPARRVALHLAVYKLVSAFLRLFAKYDL